MVAAWEALERAGVPLGGRGGPADLGNRSALVAAVRAALEARDRLTPRQRVGLLAWLEAWASGWPSSFRATFGPDAASLLVRAREGVDDVGRYLKLRRVALETLASHL